MTKLIIRIIIFIIFLLPSLSWAGTYYVSPTGEATWANCEDAAGTPGPKAGTAACAYSTANANVTAGHTVKLRGGTYTLGVSLVEANMGISPQASGSSGSKITYEAYTGETPVITSTGDSGFIGLYIVSRDYIKVDGITFRDVKGWGGITDGNYNEIVNCIFETSEGNEARGGGLSVSGDSTHNWLHNNIFRKIISASGACLEAVDLLRLGPASWAKGSVVPLTRNNTVENNLFYHAAHGTITTTSSYDVIRNNISHNEPWLTGCTTGDAASGKMFTYDTSSSSVAIGTGDKTFTVSAGKTYGTGSPIGIIRTSDHTKVMSGVVKSYSGTTLVATISYTVGSGTFDDWTMSQGNFPQYETAAYDGKFGHRNIQLGDDFGRLGVFILLEGNRIGYGGNNPGNGGPSNLDLAAPKVIVRYNSMYGGMSDGIMMKYSSADLTTQITSSTSLEIGTGEKTFTIPTGLHLTAGQTFRAWSISDKTKVMSGSVTSYTSETGSLVTNVTDTNGSGTFNDWQIFWNGASGGVNCRIYNNTIYRNGAGIDWRAYGNINTSYHGLGIAQTNGAGTGSVGNVIKNSIVYDNKEGGICEATLYDGDFTTTKCSAENWDTIDAKNLISGSGDASPTDPSFISTTMTDPLSQNLFSAQEGYAATPLPNLNLQSSSPAINAGTHLTTVHADDTSSGTTLILTDSLYFQAGSAAATTPTGSSLSNVQGDWILVGATVATAQATQITDITTHSSTKGTLTISPAIIREDGDKVWLYKKSDGVQVLYGSAPDYGAYEYEETGNVRGATISGATIQ